MQPTKRTIGICSAILSLINLALFLIFFLPYYKFDVESVQWDYCQYFLTFAVEFLLPTLSAAVLFKYASGRNKKSALLPALCLSLPRVIYLFPYYYLYMTAYGNDWLESITLSFFISLAGLAVTWARILGFAAIIYLAAKFVISRKSAVPHEEKGGFPSTSLLAGESASSPFNLATPLTFGVFAMAALQFLIYTVIEIVDVTVFLVEIDYGTFRPSELIYTIAKFSIIFIMLFVSHFLSHLIIKKLHGGKNK